jgi:hypothetical protein
VLTEDFHSLTERYCRLVGIDLPDLSPDDKGTVAWAIAVDGVDFSIGIDPQRSATCAFVLVRLGAVPAAEQDAAWRNLMQANYFMLGDRGRAFSMDPGTGDVLLQYALPCADAVAADFQHQLTADAELAHQWRHDFSIDTGAGSPMCGGEQVDEKDSLAQALFDTLTTERAFGPQHDLSTA